MSLATSQYHPGLDLHLDMHEGILVLDGPKWRLANLRNKKAREIKSSH